MRIATIGHRSVVHNGTASRDGLATKNRSGSPFSPEKLNISSCPALLQTRKLIELAFADAKQVKNGRPTEDALHAVDWIMGRTDWSKLSIETRMELWRAPAPPEEIRREFAGTFEWCCQWLGEDPDKVRNTGLPDVKLYNVNPTNGGLPKVYDTWNSKRQRGSSGVSGFVNACAQ